MAQARSPGVSERPPRGSGYSARKNNTGLILGLSLGGLALVAVVVVLVATQAGKKQTRDKATARTPDGTVNRYQETPGSSEESKSTEASKTTLPPKKSQTYEPPSTFVPGAEGYARSQESEFPVVQVDPSLLATFDDLAKKGDVATLVKEDYKWMACIIARLLCDEERIARGAFQALCDICVKQSIKTESGQNPVQMSLFNSREYRGGDYLFWASWWQKPGNREAVSIWRYGPEGLVQYASIDTDKEWEEVLGSLRGGGAFEHPDMPEGLAIRRIRGMGRKGVEKLIGFLDHEELTMVRAIVAALNHLTGENKPLPTPATKAQTKTEWEYWLKNQPR